jgi:hypothetical protein
MNYGKMVSLIEWENRVAHRPTNWSYNILYKQFNIPLSHYCEWKHRDIILFLTWNDEATRSWKKVDARIGVDVYQPTLQNRTTQL